MYGRATAQCLFPATQFSRDFTTNSSSQHWRFVCLTIANSAVGYWPQLLRWGLQNRTIDAAQCNTYLIQIAERASKRRLRYRSEGGDGLSQWWFLNRGTVGTSIYPLKTGGTGTIATSSSIPADNSNSVPSIAQAIDIWHQESRAHNLLTVAMMARGSFHWGHWLSQRYALLVCSRKLCCFNWGLLYIILAGRDSNFVSPHIPTEQLVGPGTPESNWQLEI